VSLKGCCSCGTEVEKVYVFVDGPPFKEHQHCQICNCTEAGSRCTNPTAFTDNGTIRAIAGIANLLLKEIRDQRK
jgi:hypothetical protein